MSLLLAVVSPATAQYWRHKSSTAFGGDNYHFGYISATAGYTMLDIHQPNIHAQGDWSGNIGIGYEFRNSGLWSSVGLQASRHASSITTESYQRTYEGFATNGDPATLYYDVEQTDVHQWYSLDIPVMVGYYSKGFYLGAGLKVGYYIRPTANATGQYELSGKHEQYDQIFSNMPEWGYTTYDYNQQHTMQLKPQVSFIGEIGYDILCSMPTTSTICHILKIGFYFELGLNNIVNTSIQDPIVPMNVTGTTQYDATKMQVNPYLTSSIHEGDRVAPFLTGVKLTYTIGGSRTAHAGRFHHGCMCYD